jgi:leader peptidase (prepilin peptidase) / N-methyltransferase
VNAVVTGVAAAVGLVAGDFLEIVVERLGARKPLHLPWWSCATCGASATGLGLVPVLRVVSRERGCSTCGSRAEHAGRPAVMAVVSSALLAGFAVRLGADVALVAFAVFGLSLVAISFIDLERFLIPNRIVYPTLAIVAPLLVVASAVDDRWGSSWRAAVAGVVSFAAFFVVHIAVPRGMGYGDVRLAGLIGMATGWLGFGHAFVAFLGAFVLGSVLGLAVMVATGGGRKTRIPFGPFLAAGAALSVIWGTNITHALLHTSS